MDFEEIQIAFYCVSADIVMAKTVAMKRNIWYAETTRIDTIKFLNRGRLSKEKFIVSRWCHGDGVYIRRPFI